MLGGIFHLVRGVHVGFVLAREGGLALIDPVELPPHLRLALKVGRSLEKRGVARDAGASPLERAMTRLGPSYVKFGQFLATRPDIVGMAAARDLERLQDRVPPFAQGVAIRCVEQELGKPISALFVSFSEPVAAASIAQVHKAQVLDKDGTLRDLAVKVMRPGVRAQFARELQAMRFMARIVHAMLPDAERLRPREVVETLARSVMMEMDLRLEAAAMSELAENTKGDDDFRVPRPEWEMTSRNVLSSEWIDGIRLSDRARIVADGHDIKALGRSVIQSFLRQAIRDGFFHADMHPGNLFVDRNGCLTAVDFGIMGRLGMAERRFLAEILLGFIMRDYRRVAQVHFEAGYVPRHHSVDDFAQAIRAIGEPIHQRPADEISMAKVLTLLFDVTALFDMSTRTELVMLQKTMVVVEGVARSLDPQLDMWTGAEPVVKSWIARNLGPIGRIEGAGRAALALSDVIADIPDIAQRIRRIMVRLDEESSEEAQHLGTLVKAEKQRAIWSTLAFWVIAIGVLILALK
ncbi:2-polyprenylphenol 6-hydroxylase [Methylobacterium brachythecii]|uniref:Ubiquinone biosynthesis protein n=1 Tax=Methylobacterium brachythecii TaxID=1176177 RepID=A0A7W6AJD1_9HYPH|nr:2-polyprenylphenol 6-hydroxylase [Methylobacterium brachythecii]MBB3903551.1 ubiquinone biosynthesis protein [Methylobacterium brachythecii]